MFVENPAEAIRFEPDGDTGPCYLLRVPRLVDRSAWKTELGRVNARQWNVLGLSGALKGAVERLTVNDAAKREEWLAVLDAFEDGVRGFFKDHPDASGFKDDAAYAKAWTDVATPGPEMQIIERVAREWDPIYADAVGDNNSYADRLGLAAGRLFLVGWERFDAPFRRSLGTTPDDVLAAVPSAHLYGMAIEVQKRLEPERRAMGNSG